jgi:hypothetical protein
MNTLIWIGMVLCYSVGGFAAFTGLICIMYSCLLVWHEMFVKPAVRWFEKRNKK